MEHNTCMNKGVKLYNTNDMLNIYKECCSFHKKKKKIVLYEVFLCYNT